MPEASNATKSRLDKFIQGCSQLQEIYSVPPLHYTDIMGEWWQRINDVIYALGLTEKQGDVVSIAWTVPELGKKRSAFFEEELSTKKADGSDVDEASRVSHVAGDGTGQGKAHKYGLIQSVDKLFQRNINTWGTLYEALYANSKDTSANPTGTARPVDLTDLIFGKSGISKDQINALLTAASRGLDPDSQGLANSMKNVIENIIGTSLYDWLQEHSVDGANGIGGLEDLLFGTHDKNEITDKISDATDNGSSSLFDKTNDIVNTIGDDLFDWLNTDTKACGPSYGNRNEPGPNSLGEILFGKWSMDGHSITDADGNERPTSDKAPSWCNIVANLKSGGIFNEIYNIVNYLGDPYDTYVDKVNQDKDPTNDSIPVVDEEYQKDDPLTQLHQLGVGQVLYGAKNAKNEQAYEPDWIFKEANICQNKNEVNALISSFKDQQKIFNTYNRISWATTNDDPLRNTYCYPKITPVSIVEDGVAVNAVNVEGYKMAYEAYNVSTVAGEQVAVKEVRLMPYPTLKTKIENRLGELPGYKQNDLGNFVAYATPQAFKANMNIGEWFNVVQDGTYAGHACKTGDFLLCKASGAASSASTWEVVNHDFPEFVAFNSDRIVPSWDTHNEWREICDPYGMPVKLRRNAIEGETLVTTPSLPYNVGDVYSIGETARYLNNFNCNEGDILICVNAKTADESVEAADWNRVARVNVKRNPSGKVEGFYKWWPITQTISSVSNPAIYEFWRNYTGPYSSYTNVPLFYSRDEFLNLLPTAAPEADSSDANKAKWDPRFHEVYIRGSVGPDGEYEALPADAKIGTALRVEAPGTYNGIVCKYNDTLVCTQSGTGTSNPAKWKNIHRNLNRNYGFVESNALLANYGIQNVQSSTMHIFPHTLHKETTRIGSGNVTYLTGTGCSWSTDSNDPTITGNLTSLILNREEKTHSVSGNWTSGYSLTDAGADYSTMTIDMPYSSRHVPEAGSENCKQYYWSYLYSWYNPIYKNETLVLKQMLFDDLKTGWGNSQWVVYDGTINESTKAVTVNNPKYAIINGIIYPASRRTIDGVQKWGIIFKDDEFTAFDQMAVANRKDRPQYDQCFQVVKYTTTYETIYSGKDGNNNTQMVFTGNSDSANAAKAMALLDSNPIRLSRIERRDRVTSTKKSWVFTSTQENIKDTATGITTRYATPKITETETVYTADCIRMKAIDTNTFNADTSRASKAGNPNKYPFTTVKWMKETNGATLLDPANTANFNEMNQYGIYGATSVQKTTTKTWKLNGTMTWVDNASDAANSHWTYSGNWVQDGRTTVTETVNRPLRMPYYWDAMYYLKYRAWNRTTGIYNAANSWYVDWTTYNVADIETKIADWIRSTDAATGFGVPIHTVSNAFAAEMNSWNLVQEGSEHVIKIGTNSNSFLALTSSKKYGSFTFDCTPMSYTDDDDNLGLVACHVKDHATGLDNALVIDRWSTGVRLRLNSDLSLINIDTKPVVRNLNGAYNLNKTHYAEAIHRPIITDGGEIYTENEITTPYNLATFSCSGKNWTNTGMFIWKMYTQHEGPSSAGTLETVNNGIEYKDANGNTIQSTSTYQNVKMSAQTMLNLVKPNDSGNLDYIVLSRSYSPTDTDKIKAASAYNNMYGSWIVPFHTTMNADTYWSKLNTPIQNEIKSCIKAMMRDSNNNAPNDTEAIAIFKTVVYPRYQLSTFNVEDFTLDDARKLHHATQWMTTLPVTAGASSINLNVNSYGNARTRWIFAGYGWLNLYNGVDLNYRTIIERKLNKATGSYDLRITYKDVLHRLASTDGATKRRLSTGAYVRLDADQGFNWHRSTTNNQAYKGDVIIKIWKHSGTGKEDLDSYNILAWQMRQNVTPIPLVLVTIDSNSQMKTRTYDLTLTGDNIPTDVAEGADPVAETDYYGTPLKTIIGESVDIYKINSSQSTSNLSVRGTYKVLNQLMTSIVSYGYVNCSNPLSEYRKIKFIDNTAGEIYDLANNAVWVPNPITNEYEQDTSKNYNVEQAIMKKMGVGRFLYNSETSHMFFTRGDTDSVQKIL